MSDLKSSGHGRNYFALTAIACTLLLLTATLGVPYYVAGYYFKVTKNVSALIHIDLEWNEASSRIPNRGWRIFLMPSHLAMKIAPPLRGVYRSQFSRAISP